MHWLLFHWPRDDTLSELKGILSTAIKQSTCLPIDLNNQHKNSLLMSEAVRLYNSHSNIGDNFGSLTFL